MDITDLLSVAVDNGASDLHLSPGLPPVVRIDGDLHRMNMPALEHQEIVKTIYNIMHDKHRQEYEEKWEVDFSFEIFNLSRFRVNFFTQSRGAAAAFRLIPFKVPALEELNTPSVLTEMASYNQGLVLVTGPTGSGKSTTLAAMINYINTNQYKHILTIEDPLEFVHDSNKSLVNQREVHRDTCSFSSALRSALREDPDVILVGELRDLETMRLALTAAETGHLVFGTLHTNSATKTINRIIDVFPGDEKAMVRSMLSDSLQAIVAQTLLKKIGGGRVAAFEVMICTTAIRNLIRENKGTQMYSAIQTGKAQNMMTLDQHLTQLMSANLIAPESAREVAANKAQFH